MPGLLDTYRGLIQPSQYGETPANPVEESGEDVSYSDTSDMAPEYGDAAPFDQYAAGEPPPGPQMEPVEFDERDLLKELLMRKAQERRERAEYYQNQAYGQSKDEFDESPQAPADDMAMTDEAAYGGE